MLNKNSKIELLFVGPVFYDYHSVIISKLVKFGVHVIFFPETKWEVLQAIVNTLFPSLIEKLQKVYYHLLWLKIRNKNFSHFLLIHGDHFPSFFIDKLKNKNKNIETIMYQWDSNKNGPYFHLIDLFSKTFTFDIEDYLSNKKINFLQLFYTDDICSINTKSTSILY